MSNASDFVIENGVLKKYVGPGGDVVIPDGVTSIGFQAFARCESLTSLVIPDSVTCIDNWSFYGCGNLMSITILDSVKKVGERSFQGCKSLADADGFVIICNTLYGYFGSAANVIIPENVTTVGDGAFTFCRSMKSVTIPKRVSRIGNEAFKQCYGLMNVVVPESVTYIGSDAFRDCDSLKNVKIPDGMTSINGCTFRGCHSLVSMIIPEGVTSIGNSAFEDCRSLTGITIPDSVTSIGHWAFYGCAKLTSVTIPNGVTSIGDEVFHGCRSLSSVAIPKGVTSIGDIAFGACSSLSSVTIPEGVTSIGKSAFRDCSSLTSVSIPEGVTSIGDSVFSGCYNLSCVCSKSKLPAKCFDKTLSGAIITNDPGYLPAKLKTLAAISFAENLDEPSTERSKKHFEYIKANAGKLQREAFAHPALLNLMCDQKLLPVKDVDTYLQEAEKIGDVKIKAVLLQYQSSLSNEMIRVREKKERIQANYENALAEHSAECAPSKGIKDENNHAECIDRELAEWKKIFSLSMKSYGWRIDRYKGKQHLVYIPDMIEGTMVCFVGESFPGNFAVICNKRIWDKFAKHFSMNRSRILTAMEFLKHPEAFPDDCCDHVLHYAISRTNCREILNEIFREDDIDALIAYIMTALITSKSKTFTLKELDKMSDSSLNTKKIQTFLADWNQYKRKEDIINLPWFDCFSLPQVETFFKLAQENNSVSILAWLLNYKDTHFQVLDPMKKYSLDQIGQ